ncbi:amino acid ABC transporter permease [Streptomyces sp. NBC_00669]|uniref:amino acid ABC transporter permease n=1 Tax=unclassified Streptomyces TaxID=2593676 RepID=UPI002E357619|nr:amino acid ABC transporter permease [Streptomyces sp. NBC_00669]
MTGPNRVLFDAPGPRARRRIRLATALSVLVIAGLIALGVHQLARHGQLDHARWQPFGQWPYQRFLLQGLVRTLKAAGMAALIALPAGALLALGRLSPHRVLRLAAGGFVELFRSVPLLLVLYVFLMGIPRAGYTFPVFWELVIPVVLCTSALLAEIFRAGVLALDRGQSEAGYALGMRRRQVMWLVVLPQAVRLVVPTLVSQLVSLLKDTTLGYIVSYPELLNQGKVLGSYTHDFLQSYLSVTAIYIVVNAVLSQLAEALERRGKRRPKAGAAGTGPGLPGPRTPEGVGVEALRTT